VIGREKAEEGQAGDAEKHVSQDIELLVWREVDLR
jgi:hypothetical protein